MKIRYLYVLIGSMTVLNIFAQQDLPKPVKPVIKEQNVQEDRKHTNSYQSQLSAKELCEIGNKNYKKKNYSEAERWYRKAAVQGDAEAQNNLGAMYYLGLAVSQDYSEAVKWCQKAAEQGNASAQNNLGMMYEKGRGVPQDDSEAVKWYRKAAEQGNASAQYNLGWMYEKGKGVPQDDSEAVKWYRKAAAQGDSDAQERLRNLKGS